MKYCMKCGKQVDDSTKFCPGCGSRLEVKSKDNKNIVKIVGIVIAVLALGFIGYLLPNNGDVESKFVGTWYCENENEEITVYKNHKLIMNALDRDAMEDGEYEWYINEDKQLQITDGYDYIYTTLEWEETDELNSDSWYLKGRKMRFRTGMFVRK